MVVVGVGTITVADVISERRDMTFSGGGKNVVLGDGKYSIFLLDERDIGSGWYMLLIGSVAAF